MVRCSNATRIPYYQWIPIPVTKEKPLEVYSDREPTPMRTVPRVPTQEMMPGTTTTRSCTERTRVRLPEAEAEGVPRPLHKTRTTTEAAVTRAETTSQTRRTSSASTFDERICNKVGKDCEFPTQIRRIAAAEKLSISDDIAEAQRIHPEKLTKVKDDQIIKVASRTDATTRSRMGRWMDIICDDGTWKTDGKHGDMSRQPRDDVRYGQRPTTNGTKYGQIRRKPQKRKLILCWTTLIWTSIKRQHLRNRSTRIARMTSRRT